MDTIYALATARGKAGVAIIRISGPAAISTAEKFCGALPPFRQAALRKLQWDGEYLDEALVLTFDEGHSFTGESSVEFQTHGSLAVISAVSHILANQPGVRLADAGEFTRRALMNDRLDLTQVEALADLIDAETEAQRRQSQRILAGAVGEKVTDWHCTLLRVSALIEADIDFSEEDIPDTILHEALGLLGALITDLREQLVGAASLERIRDGYEVVIVGRPNVGKSTLLNAIAGRSVALTSDIAGTTRDAIEVRLDLCGLPVTLVDTAGLRDTTDETEKMGVALSQARAKNADLRVFLGEPGSVTLVECVPGDIVVMPKADLDAVENSVSGRTGLGIPHLIDRIVRELTDRTPVPSVLIRERHRATVSLAITALEEAHLCMRSAPHLIEIAATDIRIAGSHLSSLIGRLDTEALLGEIFSSFCIGK